MSRTPINLILDSASPAYRQTQPADGAASLGGLVDAVRPGSLAAEAGLRPGCRVLRANGHVLRDVIDYQFQIAEHQVTLLVREPEGDERSYHFTKWPDDDLGLEFAEATWDGVRVCSNTCFFCFLKGLPKGLRRTLYVKDDDYRLSFLHGNFVTLTNLTEGDWLRLEEQRLSPLNVSVHATEPALRRRMLGYEDAPDIIPQLRRLGDLRIQAHTQIVLCPGVNDEGALDRTISDLGDLYPTVQSIAIVPVGATMQFEQRMGLVHKAIDETRPFSDEYARAVVRQVNGWQRRFLDRHGAAIVQAADEYYLAAGGRIPAAARYDDFAQYENGIGMTRVLLDDHRATLRQVRRRPLLGGPRRLTLACGTLSAPTLARLAEEFGAATGLAVTVVPIENRHFGRRINVSGLLTAGDFSAALAGRDLGDLVILPRASLDYFGRKFLDDGTPATVEAALGVSVAFASGFSEIVELLRGEADETAVHTRPLAQPAASNGKFWASRD